ncbi:phasin family protein [Massilia sp. BSC265]|uniref:phasin family protein n=1 Tax=Massilia sp. BSC265 TaxID=1549812 RepID=UPI00068BA5D5|nr:phasin family protein [Massilia sp. BSC265]
MTSPRDQFSAVGKAQFEAQFDFFNSIASQTLESASRVAALNLAVSRDSVQRSIGATLALVNSRDPRDVLSLGGQAEEQFRSLFAYGRELLGIAAGVRPYPLRPQALSAPQAIETVEVIERSVADATASAAAAPVEAAAAAASVVEAAVEAAPAVEAHPVAAFAPVSEPVVVAEPEAAPAASTEALAAEPVPVAEPKAIAKAVGKGAARAAAVPHPAAAPVAELATDEGTEAPKLVPAPASKRKK